MNALTHAGVLVEDKLFATLDPTSRRLDLPGGQPAMLIDTVGFINNCHTNWSMRLRVRWKKCARRTSYSM